MASTLRWMLCIVVFATSALARGEAFDPDRFSRLVEEGMARWHIPGLAVAVIDDHASVFSAGFGVTSTRNGEPVNVHTLFANASTTKAMVAAAILILADEGKLSLDDPVIEHIPELHFHAAMNTPEITIRDLLAHRTGLPSTDFWSFYQQMPLDEQIERLRFVAPEAAPRDRLIYQNTMYELAGVLIERRTGKRWDRFLDERLWRPIGMRETYGTRGQIPGRKRHVAPHDYLNGTVQELPYDLPADNADAAGSVWSSIHDMSLWAQFLLRGAVTADGRRLISEAGIREMFEPQQLATPADFYPTVELTHPNWRTYGLGWFQQDFQGRKIEFHTGSLDGLIAIMGLDLDAGRAVILMANRDHAELRHAILWDVMDNTPIPDRRDWSEEVFELYARIDQQGRESWEEIEKSRLPDKPAQLPLTAYAGRYQSAKNGDILIELTEDRLHTRIGSYEYQLSHWHLDTFLVSYPFWRNGRLSTFRVGPEGHVESVDIFGEAFLRISD